MNTDSPSHLTQRFEVFLFVALAVFFLLAPHPGLYVSNNSAFYLSEAVRLASGEAPAISKGGLVARGPVLLYLIAGVLQLTGPSVEAAFFLMKFIFAVLLYFFYLTAKSYYGRKTATLALILAVLSYRLYLIGTSIDSNSLLVLFLICFLFFVHRALKAPGLLNFFLAGLFLSASFLTKETALVFLPLLLIPVFGSKRGKFDLILGKLAPTLLGRIAPIAPWAFYVKAKTGSFLPMLGHFNPQFTLAYGSRLEMEVTSNFFGNFFGSLLHFFNMLPEVTPFAFLLVFLFFVHVLNLKPNKNPLFWQDLILFLAVLCYLPIPLSDISIGSHAPRQGYIIYFVLLMIGARWGVVCREKASSKIRFQKSHLKPLTLAALVLAAFFIFFFHKHPTFIKIKGALAHYSPAPLIKSRFTSPQKEGINWIKNNIPPGTPLIVDAFIQEPLDFFAYKRHPMTSSFQVHTCYEYDGGKPILFLLTYKKFREFKGTRSFFLTVDEPSILRDLKEGSVAVFVNKLKFLDDYFKGAPWAELLYKNQDIFIYKITSTPRTRYGTLPVIRINSAFEEDMEWARKNNPQAFSKLMERLKAMDLDYKTLLLSARRLDPLEYL